MDNTCIMCGDIIPEGRQVCPICENKVMHCCRDCTDRTSTCHDTCFNYGVYRKMIDKRNEAIQKSKKEHRDYDDHLIRDYIKWQRRLKK